MFRLHDTLDYQSRENADEQYATDGERTMRFSEAYEATNQVANALIHEGLGVGDRVAYLSKNSIEYAIFYHGCSKAGVVPVPLNYRLAPAEWKFILADAGAKMLIAQPEFAADLADIRNEISSIGRALCVNGETPGWDSYEHFSSSGSKGPPARHITPDAHAYQMYTSGTTGQPKGAVLQHSAVTAQLHQFAVALGGSPGDRSLIVAPMYHAAAALTAFATTQTGGTLFIQSDFVPAEVVKVLSGEGIRLAMLVPAMIQSCLVSVPDIAEREYNELEIMIYGASPIAENTLRRAIEIFGCDFVQGYGMTETTAAATYLFPKDHLRALDDRSELLSSAGRPLLGTEVRIVNENDEPMPNGTIGEVVVRGPQLMQCYWNRPEASAEALRGGWMHTGDAGILDDEGYLYIQDRVKDMIVSGGENVYPREIEDVLFEHPALADAAVIGVPSEKWGEAVKAVVTLKPGAQATADEIIDFCRTRLGGFKLPRSIDFIDVLPRNPSGKVLKKDLREPYWKDHDRRVG